jgi:hypothetical protein
VWSIAAKWDHNNATYHANSTTKHNSCSLAIMADIRQSVLPSLCLICGLAAVTVHRGSAVNNTVSVSNRFKALILCWEGRLYESLHIKEHGCRNLRPNSEQFKFTLLDGSCAFHISESIVSISYRFRELWWVRSLFRNFFFTHGTPKFNNGSWGHITKFRLTERGYKTVRGHKNCGSCM